MNDYWLDVENLGIKHRSNQALRTLKAAGALATPALRRGLKHPSAEVRVGCSMVLDHYLDAAAVPELVANLPHEDAQVRAWALHALVCARCKEGECRPGEDETVPVALRMLAEDPSPHVRVQAVHLLGQGYGLRPDVSRALETARDKDPDPNVRNVARRYAPGGSMYERLAHVPSGRRTSNARRPFPRKRKRRVQLS